MTALVWTSFRNVHIANRYVCYPGNPTPFRFRAQRLFSTKAGGQSKRARDGRYGLFVEESATPKDSTCYADYPSLEAAKAAAEELIQQGVFTVLEKTS